MARVSETAKRIAGELASQYTDCATEYEPLRAGMVDEIAGALDKHFAGVHVTYLACTARVRADYQPELDRMAAQRRGDI